MIRHLAFAASLSLASVASHTANYTLEPNYTQVVFRWDHLGFSTPAAQVSQGAGTLEFDQADPLHSSIAASMPLTTLNTGVPALDEDLRSDDFFDTPNFPTVTFKSTRIQSNGCMNRLQVTGDLSLHGVTKAVTLDVTIVKVGKNPRNNLPTVGFDALATIKRSDFGLGRYVPQVSDDIQLYLVSQAVETKAYTQYLKDQAAAEAAASKK